MASIHGADGERRRPPATADDDERASRRRVLGAAAALLAGGLVGVGYLSGSARADAAVDALAMDGDAITTDDGRLLGLTASVSGHVSYDGLDAPAASVVVELSAAPAGGAVDATRNRIASTSVDVGSEPGLEEYAGPYDYAFADATDFAATGDGTTTETDVAFRIALAVTDVDGAVLVGSSAATTATISVTNESRQGGARGGGSTTAQGTNQSP